MSTVQDSTFKLPSPLDEIPDHPGSARGIKLWLKRDDTIHPDISGNKWRKLKYNISYAVEKGMKHIVTAGGYWSNHLAATAVAGKTFGFKVTGIIRGEEPNTRSDTLKFCEEHGMDLHFLSRSDFDQLPESISHLDFFNESAYFIPVGGANDLGEKGCKEIMREVDIDYSHVMVPVGTATTFNGIVGTVQNKKVIGFSALKGYNEENGNVCIIDDYCFKGFAKTSPELNEFIVEFYHQNKIMLEPVYTGKMMFGVYQMLASGRIENQSRVICIHTGGLQGLKGYPDLHKALFTK